MIRSTFKFLIACLFALIFLSNSRPASAAKISWLASPDSNGCTILIDGQITSSDFERIASSLIANKGIREFDIGDTKLVSEMACLDSPGGNFEAGIKLANLFHDRHVQTKVTANSVCLSACAIAFMGGTYFAGGWELFPSQRLSRTLQLGARLSFHAPHVEVSEDRSYQGADVKKLFSVALASAAALSALPASVIPRQLNYSILNTEYDDWYQIDSIGKARRLGIRIEGLRIPKRPLETIAEELCHDWISSDITQSGHGGSIASMNFGLTIEKVEKYHFSGTHQTAGYGEGCKFEITTNDNYKIDTQYRYQGDFPSALWIDTSASFQSDYFGYTYYDLSFMYPSEMLLSEAAKFGMENLTFLDLAKLEDLSASALSTAYFSYDEDIREFFQRTLQELGLYSEPINGEWTVASAFQNIFNAMDDAFPAWRNDFGFDDGEVTSEEFADFWNAVIGCDGDKLLRNTHLCQQQDSKIARAAQACGWFSIGFCSRSASEAESKAREHDLMLLETTKAVHPNFNAGWFCAVEPQTSRSAAFSGVASLKRKGMESAYAKNSC